MIQSVNNQCEVCNTITDNFENLVNHYFDSNHNQNDLILKVKNPQIREILGLSKLPIKINDSKISKEFNQNNIEPRKAEQADPIYENKYPDINYSHENPIDVLKNIPANEYISNIPIINPIENNNNFINNTNIDNNNNTLNLNNNNNNTTNALNTSNVIKRICDICNVETEANYKGYALHVIQNHNPYVLEDIGDKFLIEFILKGGTSGIKTCDICNISISLDVNDYIVHIQKFHSNLINKSLSKYIKDRYVVSVLLGKSIYKTTFIYSTCTVCGEEIEGFEELREHMLEHKKMNNAYKGFFGLNNPQQVKQQAFKKLKKHEEEAEEDVYSTFFQNNKNNNNVFSNIQNKNNYNNNNYNNNIYNPKNKTKVNKQSGCYKQETLEEFADLLKNVNEALIIKNVNSVSEKEAKDEEIKQLKEKLNSLESKIQSMESQYKKDLEERDKVTAEIQSIMSQKNYKVADIQKELTKLEVLEERINQNSKKIEDEKQIRKSEIDRINQQNLAKVQQNEQMLKQIESNFAKQNSENDKNYMDKFNQQEKLVVKIQQENLALQENLYSKKPAEWLEQQENLKLVELPRNSAEYNSIAKMFNETHSQGGKIIKITRIQNLELWKNFCYGKLQLKRKGNDSERLLFHGTRGTDPAVIYGGTEEGFDMRHANPSGYFGVAIYFHEKAEYSNDYRFSDKGFNYLLVAKVLVGDSVRLDNNDSSLRLPPFKDRSKSERFDSVNSQGKYMIYNNFRAYPAYLIQYA